MDEQAVGDAPLHGVVIPHLAEMTVLRAANGGIVTLIRIMIVSAEPARKVK
jgi:hypothetical protein